MEYEKILNLLNDSPNQPSKFRTRNWVEIYDESRVSYGDDNINNDNNNNNEDDDKNNNIKFKTSMKRSSLCDYSDGYILFIVLHVQQ